MDDVDRWLFELFAVMTTAIGFALTGATIANALGGGRLVEGAAAAFGAAVVFGIAAAPLEGS